MPPERGRASKACTACRKIKTRCYESDIAGRSCLRCDRLQQTCSLDIRALGHNDRGTVSTQVQNQVSNDDRLNRLEQTVSALAERLDRNDGQRLAPDTSNTPLNNPTASSSPLGTPSAAPMFMIRDAASQVGLGQQNRFDTNVSRDIISKGLISIQEASTMIELFQEHYGRWVSFSPTIRVAGLLADIRRSPLLLCACCLIAVRHTTQDSALVLAPQLFQEAKTLLSSSLLEVSQSIEFFQAALILSMWSTTIGQIPLSIDSWLLSGFAIQHSLASDLWGPMNSANSSASLDKNQRDCWCTWNHLCLVHLHYCVGTRRRSILDAQQIQKCREILDSDHATNFETRMVAEVNLYWIIYSYCSKSPVDLPKAQKALHDWKQEWKFLFDQPRSQFIQMGFHFAQLLAYDQALKSRSAVVRQSLLSEMIRLSADIVNLALETADSRTRHLSDHIYHMITFAAVTLCRLLHMYEGQVASSHNIMELDSLVLTLVTWLHSIGLPCHAAHTLGDVVAAFHQRLRPNAHPSPYGDPQDDIGLYFPELLGMETFDGENFDFLPDWEPCMGPAI